MKRRVFIILIAILLIVGAFTFIQFRNHQEYATELEEEQLDDIPGLGDVDGLSDDELNQRLIDAANQMEVVPDDKK